jgi:serine/threonine protein kinase
LSQCQIIDFGIAVKNNAIGREEHGNAGTPEYQPPE